MLNSTVFLPLKLNISLKSKKVDDEYTKYGILFLNRDKICTFGEVWGGDLWQPKKDEEERNE